MVFSSIHKENPLNTIQKHRDLINEDLGYTFKDLSPNLHKFFMIHETYNFDEISNYGKLCNSGECEKKGFNEKTGVYDFKVKINPRELIPEMPRIYFTHLKIPKDVRPMDLDSSFEVFDRDALYGDVGIVYTVEYLFKNYHINLKSDQEFGYGNKIDINSYFKLIGEEAIVRANTIPLKDIECILLNLRYHELRFIYDNLGYDTDFKLGDVIKLYKENVNNKWYIRKSNLTKLIKYYKKNLPLIYVTKSYLEPFEYENYGTQFDTDSDREMLD